MDVGTPLQKVQDEIPRRLKSHVSAPTQKAAGQNQPLGLHAENHVILCIFDAFIQVLFPRKYVLFS